MVILRFQPGEFAPMAGMYALVGHFGEPSGFAVKCTQGERLPLTAVGADGPLWFVLVDSSGEDAQAA